MDRGNWTDDPCYYVTAQDGERFALVLGPFRTEAGARRWAYLSFKDGGDKQKHLALMALVNDLDPKAAFYAFGMTKMENGHREGSLNAAGRLPAGFTDRQLYDEPEPYNYRPGRKENPTHEKTTKQI